LFFACKHCMVLDNGGHISREKFYRYVYHSVC
jgi:hypothetical protein